MAITTRPRALTGTTTKTTSMGRARELKGWSGLLSPVSAWLTLLAVALYAYAVFGKGFAYLGVGPVYVGEFLLAGGLVLLLINRRLQQALSSVNVTLLLLLILCLWCAARTVPYISTYGMLALRDGALWGYAVFAVVVYGIVSSYPQLLTRIAGWYSIFARTFPVVMTLVLLVPYGAWPVIPLTGKPLVVFKPGDVGVHMAGVVIAMFLMTGPFKTRWLLWLLCALNVVVRVIAVNRGGMLAMVVAWLAALLLLASAVPKSAIRWFSRVVPIAALCFLVLVSIAITWPRSLDRMGISIETTVKKYASLLTFTDQTGTISDRLAWWRKIVGYTFGGEYFWLGKGFGLNVALDDGFDWHFTPDKAGTLRSPHNGHLTFLARAGVPGFFLWLATQVAWFLSLLGAYLASMGRGDKRWKAWFCFLICYWLAFMVNATFDVFLEGPMGGIWFWSLFGVGAGSVAVYKRGLQQPAAQPYDMVTAAQGGS